MNRVKHFRQSVKLTQQQLGEFLAIGQGAIGHYEAARREPSLEDCRAITAALAEAGAVNEQGVPVTLDDVFPPADQGGEAA